MMGAKLSKLVNVYKKYGFRGFCGKLHAYIQANYLDRVSFAVLFRRGHYKTAVEEMLSGRYDRVIVWRSSFGYNVPLVQRPQHIANNLARMGCLVIYEVTTMSDRVKTLKRKAENLYLFNFNNVLINRLLTKALNGVEKPKYLQIYSTDWKLSVAGVERYLARGFRFLYEYIDELSPALSGTKDLPASITDKYEYVMTHRDVYVVVSAAPLWEKTVARRGTGNLAFVSNGVDYEFFRSSGEYALDGDFLAILEKNKPIVMYYGALAKWFDYGLVKEVAATGEYSVVLIGIKYDGSFDENIHGEKNLYFLGPRDYSVLKYYAGRADVLTVPFLLNDITESTSPVKIFEYMALHKPIVTTDLAECRRYKSVLRATSHEDFLVKLRKAVRLADDPDYVATLDAEARANDWGEKAGAILDLLKSGE